VRMKEGSLRREAEPSLAGKKKERQRERNPHPLMVGPQSEIVVIQKKIGGFAGLGGTKRGKEFRQAKEKWRAEGTPLEERLVSK